MEGLNPQFHALYPFRSHCINVDGSLYHFLDEGSGDNLLLLHGNPSWSFYYRELILALRDRFRLIAPDHIGCGLSDKPQEYTYTLATHTANVERLAKRKNLQNITLVLHDWGGPIGLGFAVRNPELISRIILLNTVGFRLPHIPWFLKLCATPRLGSLLTRRLNLFARGAARIGVQKTKRMPALVRKAYLAPYDSSAARIAIHRFIQDIPFSGSSASDSVVQEIESGLSRLQDIPSLIVWGGRDPVFTKESFRRWSDFLPNAETLFLEDAGHYVLEDAPEQVIGKISNFLDQSVHQDAVRRSAPRG